MLQKLLGVCIDHQAIPVALPESKVNTVQTQDVHLQKKINKKKTLIEQYQSESVRNVSSWISLAVSHTDLSDAPCVSFKNFPIRVSLADPSKNFLLETMNMPLLHLESMTLVRRKLVRKPRLKLLTTEMMIKSSSFPIK
jgi:hypothetical protein